MQVVIKNLEFKEDYDIYNDMYRQTLSLRLGYDRTITIHEIDFMVNVEDKTIDRDILVKGLRKLASAIKKL